MQNKEQEKYVLRQLSLIDMKRVRRALDMMEVTDDEFLKEVLFRDAVVNYVKPFSDNKGKYQKKGLRINQKGIPTQLVGVHREIEGLRNKIIAHNDLVYQEVDFGPGISFSVKGYERIFIDHLVEPMKQLAAFVINQLLNEMHELKQNKL